jgi:PKD repeat protein
VSEPQTDGEPPVIDIIAQDNGSANQTIVFDASVDIGSGGAIISYIWDFGDGTTGTGKNPTHAYVKPGVYSIILTVTDNTGKTYTKTFVIAIEAGAEIKAQNQEFPFLYLGIALILILGILGISLLIIFRKNLPEIYSHRLVMHQERKIKQLSTKISSLNQNVIYKPVKKKYVSKDHKFSKSIDSSLEDEVDRVLLSKIEEKIDKM